MSAGTRGAQQAMAKARDGEQRNRMRRRKSRVRARAAVLIAAVVVAGMVAATAAALNMFSAATGIYVRAGDRNAQAVGTGQAIALGASDDVSVGVKLTRDIPFAPGYESWRAGTIAFQTALDSGASQGHAFMTSSALRWQVAESAVCSWLTYYVTSQAVGDSAAATSAAAQIKAAPSWPAITGLSYPSGLGPVVAAASAGDAKLVQALIDTDQAGNCLATGPFPSAGMSSADRQARLAAARRLGQHEIATDAVARRLGISGTP
jgi:hypothetical protein